MNRAERIHQLLERELAPAQLEVRDDSALHAGHAGARPGGETHYHITIVTQQFSGKNQLERQRIVNRLLKGEFDNGLHALSLKTKAPEEL